MIRRRLAAFFQKNSVSESLDEWILSYCHSDEYNRLVALLDARKMMTRPPEVAMIAGLIERLKPDRVLEIGTFFGKTALAMAEAVARTGTGKMITIDPFGQSRVPDIMRGWPTEAQAVSEFQPVYSMQFFATLEAQVMRGGPTPLGVVFVNGNHSFEYALYDIMSAAVNLIPGGAIVVDNLEQEGPKHAVLEFLWMNPAWRFFHNERLWGASEIAARDLRSGAGFGVIWGVLLAPQGIQVVAKGYKARGKFRTNTVLNGIRLNVREATQPTELTVNLLYACRPYDFHIKGEGAITTLRNFVINITPNDGPVDLRFDPPVKLNVSRSDVNYTFQLEMALLDRDGVYVLLDGEEPYSFICESTPAEQ